MRIQDIFRVTFFVALLSLAATPAVLGNCFDFNTKVASSLREALPLTPDADNKSFGAYENKITWGKLRGVVDKPIAATLALMLDHDNTKSPRVDEMKVEMKDDPNYLARHLVYFKIKPFLFITIEWHEAWGFALAGGTPTEPEKIVISYEKIDGTSHIAHLCGSVVLLKLNAKQTDVFQYEEAKATQRSPEDTLKGLGGTLQTLRK